MNKYFPIHLIVLILIRKILSFSNSITKEEVHPIICGKERCYPERGYCSPEMLCECYNDYTSTSFSLLRCDYKMISRFKAGGLELIIGFGVGHFYSLRKSYGSFKLFCYIVLVTSLLISLFLMKKIRNEPEANDHPYISVFVLGTATMVVISIIWNVIDCFLFWCNCYKDGNGIRMR